MNAPTIGTRLYNRGDMANPEHYGTLTAIKTGPWGTQYEITPDPDSDRAGAYWVPAAIIAAVDTGNGLSRIVTEAEHERWHQARRSELVNRATARKATP